MSDAKEPDDVRTDAIPESDRPGPGGSDSVHGLHEPHMHVMNDPVMISADGTASTIPGEEEADTTAAGRDTVQAMHDIFMRELAEPRDGFEPVPMWIIAVFGGLLMWGGYYLGTNSAGFRRDVFDTDEFRFADFELPPGQKLPDPEPKTVAELMAIGDQRYKSICIACHKPNGKGDSTQQYPPLDSSEWVVGEQASPARLARIVLYGLDQPITVDGKQFNGQMPPQGVVMKDYEIASVLTYIRNSWSNKGDPDDAQPAVTIEAVKAARAKVGKRGPMTAEELIKVPVTYSDLEPEAKK